MSTFNERLKDYYDRLKDHPGLIEGINNYKKNTARGKQILFSPSNEVELLVADKVTTFFIDTMEMVERSGEIDIPAFEDVLLVGYYVDLIKAFRSGDADEIDRVKTETKNLSPEEIGDMTFDSLLVLINDPYGFLDYLQEKSGITDFEDFMGYYNIANGALSGLGSFNTDLEEALVSPEIIDSISRTVDRFDSRYQQTKTKKETNQKEKIDDK